jgi:SNF2 family DNA or RNA helicase
VPEIAMTRENSLIQVSYDGRLFILNFPFDRSIISEVKKVEGADWNNRIEKKWTVPKENYSNLIQVFGTKIVWKTPDELKQQAKELVSDEESLDDVMKRVPKKIETDFMKIEPYHFQKLAVGWAATQKGKRAKVFGGLLADQMGLGKTIEAIATASYFKEKGLIKNCLVVTLAGVKIQFAGEIAKFAGLPVQVIEGTREKRLKQFQKIRDEKIFFTVTNYELLRQTEVDLSEILKMNYDMIILDEAHKMKNPETKISQCIRQIQPEYRLLMTGTPIEKQLHNIFALMDYISPNILSSDEYDFDTRRQMFEDKFLKIEWKRFGYGPKEKVITGTKNDGTLKKMIAPFMLRRLTKEVSDELPDEMESVVLVGWDNDQRKLYDKIEAMKIDLQEKQSKSKDDEEKKKMQDAMKGLLNYLTAVCDAPELLLQSESALAKQLVGRKKSFSKSPKQKRLLEMVEEIVVENEQKVVIFSRLKEMTKLIKRDIQELFEDVAKQKTSESKKIGENKTYQPFKVLTYTGDESSNQRELAKKAFQEDPNAKVIIITEAGSTGINLQSGSHLIFFDYPYQHSIYDQTKGRINRLGSKHERVYIYCLMTESGFDETTYKNLKKQEQMIKRVVEKTADEQRAVDEITKQLEEELLYSEKKSS